MDAPGFWYGPNGLTAHLLDPLGRVYDMGGTLRRWWEMPIHPGAPVICVGNLVAGGTGKTPVALALVGVLHELGFTPHFLSRGYRGRLRGPVQVIPDRHTALEVGDEPLLLAAAAPTWIARDRAAGALAAVAAGADALVLDDGFQNPAVHQDLSLVVVDGATGFGNGHLIPAGPLREPVARGLARASALVVMGEDRIGLRDRVEAIAAAKGHSLPVFLARLIPDPEAAATLRGRRVLAFAGIGRPAKFFETCREIGVELVATVPFPDHHRYRTDQLQSLIDHARSLDALLVTTAKDRVRLPEPWRSAVRELPVTVAWDDRPGLIRLLASAVDQDG